MCNERWECLDSLHPAQVRMIRELLKLSDGILGPLATEAPRIRRRQKTEAKM